MHSQMGFQLHQSHSLTVTGLKGGKKLKYWVSVGLLLLLLLLLCIYTQRNISIYYRTQRAI